MPKTLIITAKDNRPSPTISIEETHSRGKDDIGSAGGAAREITVRSARRGAGVAIRIRRTF